MSYFVALDVGGKRTGIAITDELNIIASGLTTVATDELIPFLQQLQHDKAFNTIVLGKPLGLDGKATDATAIVNQVSQKIKHQFPEVLIDYVDERFTSKLAMQAMVASGMSKKKRRQKETIDEVSATLILQTYLEQNR